MAGLGKNKTETKMCKKIMKRGLDVSQNHLVKDHFSDLFGLLCITKVKKRMNEYCQLLFPSGHHILIVEVQARKHLHIQSRWRPLEFQPPIHPFCRCDVLLAPMKSISLVSKPDSDKAWTMNLESKAQDLSNKTFYRNENVL